MRIKLSDVRAFWSDGGETLASALGMIAVGLLTVAYCDAIVVWALWMLG